MYKNELCELIQKPNKWNKNIPFFVYTPFEGKPGYTEYRVLSYDIVNDLLIVQGTGEIRGKNQFKLDVLCVTKEQAITTAIINLEGKIKYLQGILSSLKEKFLSLSVPINEVKTKIKSEVKEDE